MQVTELSEAKTKGGYKKAREKRTYPMGRKMEEARSGMGEEKEKEDAHVV